MEIIDMHSHLSTAEMYKSIDIYNKAMEEHYHMKVVTKTEAEMAEDFVKAGVRAILVGWDTESNNGQPALSNDYLANLVKEFPQAYLGAFCGVDPHKGEMAVQEIRRCVKELGMLGAKFHPVVQGFYPNDRQFYPIYEECAALGVPVQFHTGFCGMGAGLPGGMGLKLDYSRPIYLDFVAADFPNLTIIGCHPSWPWQEEMIAVLQHKQNVYNELSGWSPKLFSDSLKREITGRMQDKFMFGSEYPTLTHQKWLKDFQTAVTDKEEILVKVLGGNARRVLRLGERQPAGEVNGQ